MSLKFTAPPEPPKASSVVVPLKTDTPPEIRSAVPPLKTGTPPESRPMFIRPRPLTAQKTGVPPAKTEAPPEVTPAERVQTFYKQLSHAAVDLNAVSDELGKPIKVCEEALKRLNLGVAAWVDISKSGEEREGHWWDRCVGYTRLKDGWGIALRTRSGNYQFPDNDSEELWSFNDAPRWLRIEGVGKLPDLLGALLKQAENTTRKLRAKVTQADELAEAINAVADELAAQERK